MKSIWQNIDKPTFSSLNKNLETDVLIIGGGLSGIMTAYYLNNSNLKVTLVEMNDIGSGASGLTTGKLNYVQGNTYNNLINNFGIKKAQMYLKSQLDGLNLIKENFKELEEVDSYTFTNDETKIKDLINIKNFLIKNNITVTEENLPLDLPQKYSIKTKAYVFHPLKYLYKIAKECEADIYENTRVLSFEKVDDLYAVRTEGNTIKTKYLICATQYPFFIVPGLLPFKLCTYKSYALSAPHPNLKIEALSIDDENKSIRFYKDNIIYGGLSHKTTYNLNKQMKLKKIFKNYFKIKPEYMWNTTDIKTNDFLPQIGKLKDNLFIITGFNKWGMINSTLAGKIISDLLTNKENEYIKLFNPNRSLSLEKIKSFFTDGYLTAKYFLTAKNNNFTLVKKNGIKYGLYTDNYNQPHMVLNKCPHLGCPLTFDKNNLIWECPCHGSRYSLDGELLKGPSVKDIKKRS